MLVVIVADGLKANVDAKVGSLEQQLLHDLTRALLVGADEDAEVERRMDVGLTDIQHLRIVARENGHH